MTELLVSIQRLATKLPTVNKNRLISLDFCLFLFLPVAFSPLQKHLKMKQPKKKKKEKQNQISACS